MKIKILGSGGGDAYPSAFCSCKNCETVRKKGGKSIRSLSQTFVNDDLMIDFPADTSMHCTRYGINLGTIQNVLITHSHSDHYYPLFANLRQSPYSQGFKYDELRFYGPKELEHIYEQLVTVYSETRGLEHLDFSVMEGGQTEKIGAYTVTALNAKHTPELNPLNYIIEDGKKTLLYLLDTGYPTEETFEYLQKSGKCFDCVVMEGTMGFADYIYHMNFAENKKLKEELIRRGVVHNATKYVIAHINHSYCPPHDEIEKEFENTGIMVSYDGMEIEF